MEEIDQERANICLNGDADDLFALPTRKIYYRYMKLYHTDDHLLCLLLCAWQNSILLTQP
jgi:hypothetical protein